MLCCKCHKELAEGALFCKYCGTKQQVVEKTIPAAEEIIAVEIPIEPTVPPQPTVVVEAHKEVPPAIEPAAEEPEDKQEQGPPVQTVDHNEQSKATVPEEPPFSEVARNPKPLPDSQPAPIEEVEPVAIQPSEVPPGHPLDTFEAVLEFAAVEGPLAPESAAQSEASVTSAARNSDPASGSEDFFDLNQVMSDLNLGSASLAQEEEEKASTDVPAQSETAATHQEDVAPQPPMAEEPPTTPTESQGLERPLTASASLPIQEPDSKPQSHPEETEQKEEKRQVGGIIWRVALVAVEVILIVVLSNHLFF